MPAHSTKLKGATLALTTLAGVLFRSYGFPYLECASAPSVVSCVVFRPFRPVCVGLCFVFRPPDGRVSRVLRVCVVFRVRSVAKSNEKEGILRNV